MKPLSPTLLAWLLPASYSIQLLLVVVTINI